MLKQAVTIFFLIAITSCSFTKSKVDNSMPLLSVGDMQQDFTVFRKALEEAHPGLYWYTSKKTIDQLFDSVYGLLNQPMNSLDFFKHLLPLVSQIRCVHTNIIPSKEGVDFLVNKFILLPINIKFWQEKPYIKECFVTDKKELTGTEITAINHLPIKDIVEKIKGLLPADGFNETYKYDLLETGLFREGYAFLYGQPNSFNLEGIDKKTNKKIYYSLPAYTQQKINEIKSSRHLTADSSELNLKITDSNKTAILTINTFDSKLGFKFFRDSIHSIFKKLKERNIRSLIIDLRKNGGGNNGNVTDLYSYLADQPFLHLKSSEMKTQHFSYLDYTENQKDFKNLRGSKRDTGSFEVDYRYPGRTVREPVKDYPFNGKVFILTSGLTVSAASEFVALCHYHRRAIIIGKETGGCYYGATGGNFLRLVLPNSKIRVSIPTIRIRTAVEETIKDPLGRGILPDYFIEPGIDQYLDNEDVEVELALKLNRQYKEY